MKELRLRIKATEITTNCLDVSTPYVDTIIKGQAYTNASTKSLTVINRCTIPVLLAAQVLFSQSDGYGSTFVASIEDTTIPAGATVTIPVLYNGIYKGISTNPIYTFVINQKTIQYTLNITVPELPDTPGSISNFTINRGNREDYTYTADDFLSHHTDADGDTVSKVIFKGGDISNITFNGAPYVVNTPVLLSDIVAGKLRFIAPSQDAQSTMNIQYSIINSKNVLVI